MSSRLSDPEEWEPETGLSDAESFELSQCYSPIRRNSADTIESQAQSSASESSASESFASQSFASQKIPDAPKTTTHLGDFEAVYKGLREYERLQAQKQEMQKSVEAARDEHENISDAPKTITHLGDFEAVYKGLREYDRLQAQKQERQKVVEAARDKHKNLEKKSRDSTHLGGFEAFVKGLREYERLQAQKQEMQKSEEATRDEHEDLEEESWDSISDSALPSTFLDQEADLDMNTARPKEVRWEDDVLEDYPLVRNAQRYGISDYPDRQDYLVELRNFLEFQRQGVSREPPTGSVKESPRTSQIRGYKHPYVEDCDSEKDFQQGSTSMSDLQPLLGSPIAQTRKSRVMSSATQLTPAWVTPILTRPNDSQLAEHPEAPVFDGLNIFPLIYLTRLQKEAEIIRLLFRRLGYLCFGRVDPCKKIGTWGGNLADDGIHVFVDSSNITIGFHESLKHERGINVKQITRRPPLCFHSLAFILERGRPVAKRILVGSSDGSGVRPQYMDEAERCGYETNVLERVRKSKGHLPSRRRSKSNGNGYGTSGQSSGSESGRGGRTKVIEQAVDEIAHLKMLESMLDYADKPSTIVLATGDAAEAEFSGGFLVMIKRALLRGWKVELVAWGNSMNNLFKSDEFLMERKEQFVVVDLEGFAELLLDIYKEPVSGSRA